MNIQFKKSLHEHVSNLLHSKMKEVLNEINDLSSSGQDSKSSMGDKHETSRALIHLEQEKLSSQLERIENMHRLNKSIEVKPHTRIGLGSVFQTDMGYFYISVSLGKIMHEDYEIFVLSSDSPLAKSVIGKGKGDKFTLNSKNQNILNLI